jgi:protein-S-isoprenylcysteine O-methyltransferase Ste14
VAGFAGGLWLHRGNPWPIAASDEPLTLLIVGGALVGLGGALFWLGLETFLQYRTGIMLQRAARLVVTSGPYRWSRNPQYVAFVAIYLGVSILTNSVWPLLALPAVIVATNALVIAREERYLRRTFNGEYDAYCRRVQRWL